MLRPRSGRFRACPAIGLAIAAVVVGGATAGAQGPQLTNLPRPRGRQFVVDKADLISADDEARIGKICDKLLTDKATPIIVVTINSMAAHGGRGMRIETFAMMLFNQWGIGHPKLAGKDWNTGMLLLVSKYDRKARIELGAGWTHEKDQLARQIMDEQIIPPFKRGDFSEGIVAGVESLDKMGRGLELPRVPRPWWHYALIGGFVGLAIFTVVSLVRRGASGWAWLFWAAIFALVGTLLYHSLTSGTRGGGGFSGGSFGGGFSGGGGATGSW